MSFLTSYLPLILIQGLSLAWSWLSRVGWLASEPQGSTCLQHSPGMECHQQVPPCQAFLLGFPAPTQDNACMMSILLTGFCSTHTYTHTLTFLATMEALHGENQPRQVVLPAAEAKTGIRNKMHSPLSTSFYKDIESKGHRWTFTGSQCNR